MKSSQTEMQHLLTQYRCGRAGLSFMNTVKGPSEFVIRLSKSACMRRLNQTRGHIAVLVREMEDALGRPHRFLPKLGRAQYLNLPHGKCTTKQKGTIVL